MTDNANETANKQKAFDNLTKVVVAIMNNYPALEKSDFYGNNNWHQYSNYTSLRSIFHEWIYQYNRSIQGANPTFVDDDSGMVWDSAAKDEKASAKEEWTNGSRA
tara:strand:- start:100 stop:414 length:315 start_codon:yes stop_codon:yes gene_type:complete